MSHRMAHQIELPELQRLIDDGVQLVEVMPAPEYREAHLPGAINLPLKELDAESADDLDRSRPVVVYCNDYL
jgi:rhodanese-related sulfurtransferase